MLESKNTGSAQTNPNYQTLLAFKPRQVLLAERSAKVTTMKQCSTKTLTLNPDQKALLLQSVLGYLQSNGFSKALKRLLSDAQIETDNWKTCSLNLEDMYGNYLETCIRADTNLDTNKDQGLLTDGSTKKSGDSHTSVIEQTVGNKKKKKSNKGDNNAVEICSENGIAESSKNSMEVLVKDSSGDANVELKEKKKSKKVSDSVQQTEEVSTQALHESTADTVSELQIDASIKKQKDKRKKKSNTISESGDANVERVPLDTLQVVNEEKFCITKPSLGESKIDSESEVKLKKKSNDDNKVDSEAEGKPQDKKKKKKNKRSTDSLIDNVQQHNSALENMHDVTVEEKKVESKEKKRKKDNSDTLSGDVPDKEDLMTRESKEEPFRTLEGAIDKEKKSSKKRKRLVSEENEVFPIEKVQSEELKRRKTETSEETKNCERVTEVIANAGDDKHAGDDSKSKNGSFSQFELQNTFIKQIEAPTNGNFEKDGVKSTAQKTRRKQQEGSAEPKTVNAFQRVKVDEVNFADERLQDNSYWAKGGAEVGYGAKAQEILGQVKGRDFRHEKTKKKRGSYRGGQIDLHTHSVKFNYSDED